MFQRCDCCGALTPLWRLKVYPDGVCRCIDCLNSDYKRDDLIGKTKRTIKRK